MAQTAYRAAENRIIGLFGHDPEAVEFCMADWPNEKEHLNWLITAPAEEIAEWIDAGKR